MEILGRLEKALEQAIEGIFSRAFKAKVQPIEVAKRLAREMEAARTIGISTVYAPNRFTALLSAPDLEALAPFQEPLSKEIEAYLDRLARERGYQLLGPIQVGLEAREEVKPGEVRVEAESVSGPLPDLEGTARLRAEPRQWALLGVRAGADEGKEFPLFSPLESVGRATTNTIRLSDPGVSRRHAQFKRAEEGCFLVDLGSTNGTFLGSSRLLPHQPVPLRDGDRIRMGSTVVEFRLVQP